MTYRLIGFILCLSAFGLSPVGSPIEEFQVVRQVDVYAGPWLTPSQILSEDRLWKLNETPYVKVRGWAVYYSNPADGDDHFSIIDSSHIREGAAIEKPELHKYGLTCEIKPAITLSNRAPIRSINRKQVATYRFVEVWGHLRFGTEGASGHDAVREYKHGGKKITGHWEIHPVEYVKSFDSKPPFECGPSATNEDPMAGEMSIMQWDIWKSMTKPNNHARLKAKVLGFRKTAQGDTEIELQEVTSASHKKKAIAIIPPYFGSYDESSNTMSLTGTLLGDSGSTLKTGDHRYFFGLRSWTFPKNRVPAPVVWPVMRIDKVN